MLQITNLLTLAHVIKISKPSIVQTDLELVIIDTPGLKSNGNKVVFLHFNFQLVRQINA